MAAGLSRTLVSALAASLSLGIPSGTLRTSGPPVASQLQAPGRPYSGNCSVVLPEADRLAKGLDVQEKAIARTEAQIAAAKGRATRQPVEVGTPDQAKTMVGSLMAKNAALRKEIEALKLSADASASRQRVLGHFDKIDKVSSAVDVALAGVKYQQAMADVKDLQHLAEMTATYLSDSGLGDMLAGELGGRLLGEALGGPAGILVFEASVLAIEVGARLAEQQLNANELEQAERTRDALKFHYDALRDRIDFMRQNCRPGSTSQSEPADDPDPPKPASGKKAAKAGGTPDGQRGHGSAAKVAAVGAVAGGAVAAAYGVKIMRDAANAAGGGSCDASKAPINEINTYCFGATRNTSLCNQYIAQYDSFCKSCGFSRFDSNAGGCR